LGCSRLIDDQQVAVLDGGPLAVHAFASCPHEEGGRAVLNEQFVQVQFTLQMIVSGRRETRLDSGGDEG
jgi:hypothetical protein